MVDGHSSDNTVQLAQKHGANVHYENHGTRAFACQIGLENAKGDYVAFTDADCRPAPHWLENLLARLAGERNSRVVGAGSKIVHVGIDPWSSAIGQALSSFIGSGVSIQGRQYVAPRYVKSISGSSSLYRKRDVQGVGGFNIHLPTCEDAELNARLRRIGLLVYDPTTWVIHSPRRGPVAFAKRMRQYGFGRAISGVYSLPTLLPASLPFLVLGVIIFPFAFLAGIAAYAALLYGAAVGAYIQLRDLDVAWRVPVLIACEHSMYVLGFWAGIGRKLLGTDDLK